MQWNAGCCYLATDAQSPKVLNSLRYSVRVKGKLNPPRNRFADLDIQPRTGEFLEVELRRWSLLWPVPLCLFVSLLASTSVAVALFNAVGKLTATTVVNLTLVGIAALVSVAAVTIGTLTSK